MIMEVDEILTEEVDDDQECGIMVAHYFFFISIVNQRAFLAISCTYAEIIKFECTRCRYDEPSFFENAKTILWPVLSWISVTYKFHFTHLLLTISAVTIASPITYFFNWVKPGNRLNKYLFIVLDFTDDCIMFLPRDSEGLAV